MLASWYDEQGPAADVLHVGELPDAAPGPGEVRVRVTVSGVNPGDAKKRRGWLGSSMAYPRVIPHSDAAGAIDAVGDGVDAHRVGQRVWVYGAQSYRPFGTAAQYTVVPADLAVPLPDHLSDELGAGLGIPGITAHRTVFSDGPVDGQLVLVHGVLGGVGSLAAQLARWGGATVIGTVRRGSDLDRVNPAVASHAVALDGDDPVTAIRAYAPAGVHRIIEVALSDNADLDSAIVANGAVIAAYATRDDRPQLPFWPLLFNNVTLRMLGRQRRLPRCVETAGGPRPHRRGRDRHADRRHRRPVPTGEDRPSPRPCRRRQPRPRTGNRPWLNCAGTTRPVILDAIQAT